MMLQVFMAWVAKFAFLLCPFGVISLMILVFSGDGFWYLGDTPGWRGKFWIVAILILISVTGLWIISFLLWFTLWTISLGVDFFDSWIEIFRSI